MTRFGPKDYALIVATSFIFGVLAALLWRELSAFYGSLCISVSLFFVIPHRVFRAALIGWVVGQGWVWVYTHSVAELNVPPTCLARPLIIEATVHDFVEQYAGFNESIVQRADLAVASVSLADCAMLKRIRVYYTGSRTLRLGDRITGQVTLRSERGFANFGSDKRKAHAVALQRLANGRLETVYGQHRAHRGVNYWRLMLAQIIRTQEHLSGTAKGVIAALVVADKRYIPERFQQMSLRLGVGHVLVISGLHVALVAGFANLIVRGLLRPLCWFAPLWVRQIVGDALVFAAALVYALLAGWSLPTQRAVLALGFWLSAKNMGREGQPIRLFWWALVLCLWVNPFTALLPAFWLSFGAVFLVLISSTALGRLSGVRMYVLSHVAICVAMWPASLVFFGQASLLSIPANIIAVPVASLWLVPLSLLGAVACLWGFTEISAGLWLWAAWPLDWVYHLLDSPWLEFGVWQGAVSVVSALVLTILWVLLLTPIRPMWRVLALSVSLCILLYRPLSDTTERARLWVFDVGQGSSMLLQVANRSLLFDLAGGMPGSVYYFDQTAAPILRRLNLSRLDAIVLSHEDFDHVGGFYSPHFNFGWDRLISPSGEGPRAQVCRPGRVEQWAPQVRLQWLSGDDAAGSDNDTSCVLKVEAYGYSVLFMADLGKRKERDLVSYWRDSLEADLLVVGHHGSDTSSSATFLKWVKPKYAVISAGYDNAFGHPSAAVMKRLHRTGATILNTADTGALRFEWGQSEPLDWLATRTQWARFWQDNYSI